MTKKLDNKLLVKIVLMKYIKYGLHALSKRNRQEWEIETFSTAPLEMRALLSGYETRLEKYEIEFLKLYDMLSKNDRDYVDDTANKYFKRRCENKLESLEGVM